MKVSCYKQVKKNQEYQNSKLFFSRIPYNRFVKGFTQQAGIADAGELEFCQSGTVAWFLIKLNIKN